MSARAVVAMLGLVASLIATMPDAGAQDDSTTHNVIEAGVVARSQRALTLDSNDYPVLAYLHRTPSGDRSLKVARCVDAACQGAIVAELVNVGPGERHDSDISSIAVMLDDDDLPVIGYVDDDIVHIARCQDRVCEGFELQLLGVGRNATFALDSQGRVVTAFNRAAVDGNEFVWAVDVTRCGDTQCNVVTTNRIVTLQAAARPAVAVDRNDVPVVAYAVYGDVANSLIVARCVDPACEASTQVTPLEVTRGIDPSGGIGAPLMVLDSNDYPVITVVDYTEDFSGEMHFIACLDVDCSVSEGRIFGPKVEDFSGAGALAVNAEDTVSVILASEGDGDEFPAVMKCLSRSCVDAELVGYIGGQPARSAEASPAMALDRDGRVVVAYTAQSDLTVARCGSMCSNDAARGVVGDYYLQNVKTGRYLDLDADGLVGSSVRPRSDDVWEIAFSGPWQSLRNVHFDLYLDSRASIVETSDEPAPLSDLRPDRNNLVTLRNPWRYYVSAEEDGSAVEAIRNADGGRSLWRLIPVEPDAPSPFVGARLAFQNVVTGRWLDNDANGEVNQSVRQSADDVWAVSDAGGGFVYLVNEATGRYLDADDGKIDLDSSLTLASDKRWDIRMADGQMTLRNVRFDGYVTAQDRADLFNTIRQPGLSLSSFWLATDLVD